jgi:hypothetical protein
MKFLPSVEFLGDDVLPGDPVVVYGLDRAD